MVPAPIALFAYNRPGHLRRTVETLLRNELASASDLIIHADGAKGDADREGVNAVREYLTTIKGFKSVTVHESPVNRGLAASIIAGVTEVVNRYGKVIVLEDDLETSPHFLSYMNDALRLYADTPEVYSVHAYVYPVTDPLPETFFLRGADCWGWGTWQRAWQYFRPDAAALLNELKARGLIRRFDFDGTYGNSHMLDRTLRGEIDSWAIRWHASAFLRNGLTLYPGRSLVRNIGNDASGTHSGATKDYDVSIADGPIAVERQEPQESETAYRAFVRFHRRYRPSMLSRAISSIRRRF